MIYTLPYRLFSAAITHQRLLVRLLHRLLVYSVCFIMVFGIGFAASETEHPIQDVAFSFEGPFGRYDPHQLQRGLQVFTEVCSACHGLSYVPLRSLGERGGPEMPPEQVQAYAALYEITDPKTDETRARIPTDNFPVSSIENAPDLSLMAKARAGFHGPYGTGLNQLLKGTGGPEYIVALLQGYTGREKEEAGTTLYENTVYPGGWIAMAPPLSGDDVSYRDGKPTDLPALSQDVAAFLMWTAEPKLDARKKTAAQAIILLGMLCILLYFSNKKLWLPIKRGNQQAASEHNKKSNHKSKE